MTIETSSVDLPAVAREYFATANALNSDRTVVLLTDGAVVTDEGQRVHGREAIHERVVV